MIYLTNFKKNIVKKFREAFPFSKDLAKYNNVVIDENVAYEKWLKEKNKKMYKKCLTRK